MRELAPPPLKLFTSIYALVCLRGNQKEEKRGDCVTQTANPRVSAKLADRPVPDTSNLQQQTNFAVSSRRLYFQV